MTDARTTIREGVHLVRLVESPVETSAVDRRFDYVAAPKPRAVVLRPTTNTQFVVTSAIDLRDDVLRNEVPGIVGDVCHGVLGAERDAIVQAIEQEDTQPIRRFASGTTPPAIRAGMSRAATLLRSAAERADVAVVRELLEDAAQVRGGRTLDMIGADEDALEMALGRGSSPSLDRAVAFARGSSSSLDADAEQARASAAIDAEPAHASSLPETEPVHASSLPETEPAHTSDVAVYFVPMARSTSYDEVAAPRMTLSRFDGGRTR